MAAEPTELTQLTAAQIAAAVAAGEVSAVEVTQAHLDRIAAVDPDVHAFLHVAGIGALAAAGDMDGKRAAGEPLRPLAGVPLALKDVMTTQDMPTTCGSRILEGWRPPYDATVTRRLRDAGVVILGKTNMDEFAMGSSTENSAYGPSHNPWDLGLIPGGSSGGSSAAVAAYEAPLAIGTDSSGSIRQPAAVCGIVGMKPTYGGSSGTDWWRLPPRSTPRPAGPHSPGRGAAARGDLRARPVRLDVGGRASPAGCGRRPAAGRVRAAHRRGGRVQRRRLPARRPGPVH